MSITECAVRPPAAENRRFQPDTVIRTRWHGVRIGSTAEAIMTTRQQITMKRVVLGVTIVAAILMNNGCASMGTRLGHDITGDPLPSLGLLYLAACTPAGHELHY